jgi:hypothetical protein
VRTDVASGVTDTGPKRALYAAAFRNNKTSSGTDAGTLSYLRGAEIAYGHAAVNTALTPATTEVIGLILQPYNGYGTVTYMYDVYIASDATALGTITNHWALYQASTTAKSYFAGSVGIGTNNPGSKLEVIPGGGQGINCLNNGGAGTVNYALMGQATGTASVNTGLYVNVTGATTNYGVRIVSPAAATNNYAIYSDATAQSYFAGNIGIGVTPTTGKGVLQLSGGISFPATANLSADANTLDDYEEGTFTPALTASTTNPTVTYSAARYGAYVKIGRLVFINCRVLLTALTAAGSGNIRIAGLPFTSNATDAYGQFAVGYKTAWTTTGPSAAYIEISQSYINLVAGTATGVAFITQANLSATSDVMITGFYTTTS